MEIRFNLDLQSDRLDELYNAIPSDPRQDGAVQADATYEAACLAEARRVLSHIVQPHVSMTLDYDGYETGGDHIVNVVLDHDVPKGPHVSGGLT